MEAFGANSDDGSSSVSKCPVSSKHAYVAQKGTHSAKAQTSPYPQNDAHFQKKSRNSCVAIIERGKNLLGWE